MKTTKLIILFTLLLIVFTLAPGYLLAEITNRIVARVNSDIITLHDLNTSIKKLTGSSAKDLQLGNEKKFYEMRRAILDNLINEKITEQQIIKLGIKVTAKDVEEAIEKVKKENNFTQEELINSLKQKGVSLKEYKDEVEKEIERFRFVNYEVKSKIVITEEEIKKYYQTHSKEYTEVSKVRLERIFLKVRSPNDKEEIARVKSLGVEILQRLKQGHDFSEMAKIYSQGPAGTEGGNLGWIKASQLELTLRKKIDELLVGEHTDLDFAPSGFQIIKLAEEKKGGLKPFEEIRDAIYSKLFKEKVEKRYATWLNKLRKESFIKVTF
ncbi:MAG TPA: SurA N-terminal domain-containing protein [Desulfatiglandales bacterium]|nr:SurA N-terminal domain-containing protein [Desulfatiglandales bacterium]